MSVDVQIIMATNRNLEECLKKSTIREDFYYRIRSFEIALPPLRERKEDIPVLVEYFLNRLFQQGRTKISQASTKVLEQFMAYHWPGNVRELENAVESSVIYANYRNHNVIELDDISLRVNHPPAIGEDALIQIEEKGTDLERSLAGWELKYLEKALRMSQGSKSETARLLGLNDRFALRRRVKSLQERYPELVMQHQHVCQAYPMHKSKQRRKT